MTTTVAEMRVEQLKRELADAEAAQLVTKTLASELSEAETAANEACRLVQINKQSLAEAVSTLESVSRDATFIPQGMSGTRAQNDQRKQQAHQAVSSLTVERDKLGGELSKKQHALGQVVKQISEHPAYKTVRGKQTQLVADATKLATSIFSVPLGEIASVLKKIETLADTENQQLGNVRAELRSAGLPEVKPLLARFVQQVAHQQLLDAIPGARKQVTEAVARVTEFASRDVLR